MAGNSYRPLLILRILLIGFLLAVPQALCGQAFEAGYQAFLRGDYRKARGLLIRGIKQSRDPYDKASMYKLLGITMFELGSRSKASAYFKRALKLDPASEISSEESRNPNVRRLFAKVKRSSGGSRGGSRRGRNSQIVNRGSGAPMAGEAPSTGSPYLGLIPFGVGHFMQGKTLWGAALAGGQVAGIFLYLERSGAADQADKDALEAIAEFESGAGIPEDQFAQYINENEAFVNSARSQATYGIVITVITYGIGVAESFLLSSPSTPPPSPVPTRGRPPGRPFSLLQSDEDLKDNEVLESVYYAPRSPLADRSRFQVNYNWNFKDPVTYISYRWEF